MAVLRGSQSQRVGARPSRKLASSSFLREIATSLVDSRLDGETQHTGRTNSWIRLWGTFVPHPSRFLCKHLPRPTLLAFLPLLSQSSSQKWHLVGGSERKIWAYGRSLFLSWDRPVFWSAPLLCRTKLSPNWVPDWGVCLIQRVSLHKPTWPQTLAVISWWLYR